MIVQADAMIYTWLFVMVHTWNDNQARHRSYFDCIQLQLSLKQLQIYEVENSPTLVRF